MSNATHFCPQCGYKNIAAASFCEGCGAALPPAALDTVGSIPAESPLSAQDTVGQTQTSPQTAQFTTTGDRVVAFIIDSIVFQLATSILGLFFGRNWVFGLGTSWTDSIWSVAFGFLYFFLMEAYNHGQTLGKMAMKLKTVDAQTLNELTPSQAAIHSIGKNVALVVDLLIGFFTREKEKSPVEENTIRFTQRLAKTAVIKIAA